jgi:hypothetical protein
VGLRKQSTVHCPAPGCDYQMHQQSDRIKDATSKPTRPRTSFYGTNRPNPTRVAVSTGPNRSLSIWATRESMSNPTSPMGTPHGPLCAECLSCFCRSLSPTVGIWAPAGGDDVIRASPVRGTAGACPLIVIMHLLAQMARNSIVSRMFGTDAANRGLQSHGLPLWI